MKTRVLKHHFSLIELLVVCGILLILAGIGIGVYSLVNRKMQDSRCKAMIAKMSIALESYKAKTGYYIKAATTVTGFYVDKYKSTGQECSFNDFIDIPNSDIVDGGNYRSTPSSTAVSGSALKDPWGVQFRYQCPGTHNRMSFDLYSFGSDKLSTADVSTQADDITNWKQ
jgi:type II secretory pathway pseudopilin PulG